jgi:hypothetical protein
VIAAAARSGAQHHAIRHKLLVKRREIDALEYTRRIGRLDKHRVSGLTWPAGHIRRPEIGRIDLGAGDFLPAIDAARRGRGRSLPHVTWGRLPALEYGLSSGCQRPHDDGDTGDERRFDESPAIKGVDHVDRTGGRIATHARRGFKRKAAG